MPTSEYYRRQAQICAALALTSSDPTVIARSNTMALEHLARAAEVDGLTDSYRRGPTCPQCARPMHTDRLAARVIGAPEERTYLCLQCWGDVVVLPEQTNNSEH